MNRHDEDRRRWCLEQALACRGAPRQEADAQQVIVAADVFEAWLTEPAAAAPPDTIPPSHQQGQYPTKLRPGIAGAEPSEAHGIGWAVKQMQANAHVRRRGWNGKNMWLVIEQPNNLSIPTVPYVLMRTADGQYVPWLCSQSDLLATDWEYAA